MKRLICALFGHKWRYEIVFGLFTGEIQSQSRECTRCGVKK